MIPTIILITGIIIGSFLNVCIYRIPREESIVFPSSHCTSCGTGLRSWDLVPVFSYLFNRGKCRYCGEKISPQYPIIEVLNGLLYLLLYLQFGLSVRFITFAIITSILLIITIIDYKTLTIPNGLVLLILTISLAYQTYQSFNNQSLSLLLSPLLSMFLGGGILLFIAVVTKGAMGGGDIKLMGALGLLLGIKYTVLTLFLSFVVGGIISVILLISKIKKRGQAIPFGPFIALASFISMVWGRGILDWYFNTMFL